MHYCSVCKQTLTDDQFYSHPYGKDGLLKPDEVNAVVDYVLALSGGEHKPAYEQGKALFQQNCASCHGPDGKGGREFGAPNLADQIWLYGGDRKTVYETVFFARAGVMPTWKDRLDDNMIKALAVYVHELGGGEASSAQEPQQEAPAPEMAPPAGTEAPAMPEAGDGAAE